LKYLFNNRIIVLTGDITKIEVDAVVNAANSKLLGGGGVDGAIHREGGPDIIEECREIRKSTYPSGMPAGNSVITTGGYLPADYVIHTVGPVWHGGKKGERIILESAYLSSLTLAASEHIDTIAFPAISTGIYSYPKVEAAQVAYKTVTEYLNENKKPEKVYFVFFSSSDMDLFLKSIEDMI
jgi:O-acetyl-ADP-ribose deacetylase (regulator of RNase III)